MSVVFDSASPIPEVAMPPALDVSLRPLTVDQYHEMVRQGILTEDDRVELLEGLLVAKMTISPPHRLATRRIRVALERVVPRDYYVDSLSPITLPARDEPEPDVVVVRGADGDYAGRHPGPGDVPLVVEVSDSTLRRDRGFKKAIYARAGIPVYWIINLIDRRAEVYTDPTGPAERPDYRQRQDIGEAGEVPVVLEGDEIARLPARELLP